MSPRTASMYLSSFVQPQVIKAAQRLHTSQVQQLQCSCLALTKLNTNSCLL
jgi:hypothetical protein